MFGRFSQVTISVMAGVCLVVSLFTVFNGSAVWAEEATEDQGGSIQRTVESDQNETSDTDSEEAEDEGGDQDNSRGEWKHGRPKAMSDLAWRRVCQLRQRAVDHRVSVIRGVMRRQVDFMDRLFVRVQTLVEERDLTVAGYDVLITDAKLAQAAVKNSTDGVTAAPPELDCDDDDFRDEVIAFRNELHQIVGSLRDYRDSLKGLVQAVREAWDDAAGEVTQ